MGITNKDVLKTVLKVPQLEEQMDNKANKKTNVVYITDYIGTASNIADFINSKFLEFSSLGGIEIVVDASITITKTILMQDNCTLRGVNRSIKITLGNNCNCDLINWNSSQKAKLECLYLDGNKANNTTGSGLICSSTKGGIVDGSIVRDIDIYNCKGDGLKVIYPIWVIVFDNVRIGFCDGYGLYNDGTDNKFNNIYIMHCGKKTLAPYGLCFKGGNNKMNGCKVIFSGYYTSKTDKSAGVFITGASQQIVNLEAQENLGGGVQLFYIYNSDISLLSDCNTPKNYDHTGEIFGVEIDNCQRNIFNILCTNFEAGKGNYHDNELVFKNKPIDNTINFKTSTNVEKEVIKNLGTRTYDYELIVNNQQDIVGLRNKNYKVQNKITDFVFANENNYWNSSRLTNGLLTFASASTISIKKDVSVEANKIYLGKFIVNNNVDITNIDSFLYDTGFTNISDRYIYKDGFKTIIYFIYKSNKTETRSFGMDITSNKATTVKLDCCCFVDITDVYSLVKYKIPINDGLNMFNNIGADVLL